MLAFSTSKLTLKVLDNKIPETLYDTLTEDTQYDVIITRNQRARKLRQKPWQKTISRRSYSYRAIDINNKLPESTKMLNNTYNRTIDKKLKNIYKDKLKSYIRKNYPYYVKNQT